MTNPEPHEWGLWVTVDTYRHKGCNICGHYVECGTDDHPHTLEANVCTECGFGGRGRMMAPMPEPEPEPEPEPAAPPEEKYAPEPPIENDGDGIDEPPEEDKTDTTNANEPGTDNTAKSNKTDIIEDD